MLILTPTHECFNDALELLTEFSHECNAKAMRGWRLVHAIVLQEDGAPSIATPKAGEPYAHAWVENSHWVWDAALHEAKDRVYYKVDKRTFYELHRVQRATRYTFQEALKQNRLYGTFGPWEEAYLALCRKQDRR